MVIIIILIIFKKSMENYTHEFPGNINTHKLQKITLLF